MDLLLKQPVDTAAVMHSNPNFYDAYRIAGDYCLQNKWYPAAIGYYKAALTHEVATQNERRSIQGKIDKCEKQLKLQLK